MGNEFIVLTRVLIEYPTIDGRFRRDENGMIVRKEVGRENIILRISLIKMISRSEYYKLTEVKIDGGDPIYVAEDLKEIACRLECGVENKISDFLS